MKTKTLNSSYNSIAFLYYLISMILAAVFFILETGSFSTLCFHEITTGVTKNPFSITIMKFKETISSLQDEGYHFISAQEIKDYYYSGTPLKKNSLFLTFDDGTTGHYNHIRPWLNNLKIPAGFGIVSNLIGTKGFATDRELEELFSNRLFTPFFHSNNHKELWKLNPKQALHESTPPEAIRKMVTQKSVTGFIYPYGVPGSLLVNSLKKIWDMAFTLDTGFTSAITTPWRTPRFLISKENIEHIAEALDFHNPFTGFNRVMKILVLLLTLLCGRFVFLARDIRENRLRIITTVN